MLNLRPISSALAALMIASAMSGCGEGKLEPTTAPTSVSSVAPTTADAVAKAAAAAKVVAAAKAAEPAEVVAKAKTAAKAKAAALAKSKGKTAAPARVRAKAGAAAKAKAAAEVRKLTAVPSLGVGATVKDVKAVVSSLQARGDIYFAAADYKNAAVWETKVLAVDPRNQVALLVLGAARFNVGNVAEAKKQWLVAAALYPNLAEVHYDLGFLYMSQTPPETAKMTAEWKKVVAIDPDSQLSKMVASQLKDR
jgi:tetratricopeptide (TPR) repeat protein